MNNRHPLTAHLRRVRRYIDLNASEPITIDGLSHQASLSRYHFIRAFRAVFRQTPHQYLITRRIQKAKELLRTSDLPITEICAEVGFESLGSFSTLFAKLVGLSPRRYRQVASKGTAANAHIPLCNYLKHGLDYADAEPAPSDISAEQDQRHA